MKPRTSRKVLPKSPSAPHRAVRRVAPVSIALVEIAAIDDGGRPWVRLEDGTVISAATTVPIDANDLGRRAAILIEGGKAPKAIVTGVVRVEALEEASRAQPPFEVQNAGGRLRITAPSELTLKCGAAVVTLFADGTIKAKGTNVASIASGQNRILGASVKIN